MKNISLVILTIIVCLIIATDGAGQAIRYVKGTLTAGTGVTISGAGTTNTISIGQAVGTTSTPQFARLGIGAAADANIPFYLSHTSTTQQGWRMVYPNSNTTVKSFEISNVAGTGGFAVGTFTGSYEGWAYLKAPIAQGGGAAMNFEHGSNTATFQLAGSAMVFRNTTTGGATYYDGASGGQFWRNSSFTTKASLSDAGTFNLVNFLSFTGTAFASLGTPANGTFTYCTDCVKGGNPCAGSGTGALAQRLNGIWRCD